MHKGKLRNFIKKGFEAGTEVFATPFGSGPYAYTIYSLDMKKKGFCHQDDIEFDGFVPDVKTKTNPYTGNYLPWTN